MTALRPFVSVIIPVFNDFERLLICLAALEHQSYPAEAFEIVVVDNGSARDLAAIVSGFAHVRMFKEEQPGAYCARNCGIREARGEILAFTDADCIPAADWLVQGVNELTAVARCGLLAGRIDVFCPSDRPPTAVELYDSVRGLLQKQYVTAKGFGATANVFTWRKVVDSVGPFDTKLKSCGDMEWGRRVSRAGYKIAYSDATIVAHPARGTFSELRRKMRRVAGGLQTLRSKPDGSDAGRVNVGYFFRDLNSIVHDSRLHRRRDTIKVLAVALYVELVKVEERVRLLLGGQPVR